MNAKSILTVVIVGFAVTVHTTAHPHVGIDVVLEPLAAEGVLVGVEVTWIFEREAYNYEITDDYDRDGNEVLDEAEVERLRGEVGLLKSHDEDRKTKERDRKAAARAKH